MNSYDFISGLSIIILIFLFIILVKVYSKANKELFKKKDIRR